MNKIIPTSEHKVFKKTFLEEVSVKIKHEKFSGDADFELLKGLFVDNFRIDFTDQHYSTLLFKSLRFHTKDRILSIKMSSDFIHIKMDGEFYYSFADSLRELVFLFVDLLDKSNKSISEISIEKLNFFPSELKNSKAYTQLIEDVFSENLKSHISRDYSRSDFRKDLLIDTQGPLQATLSFGWLFDKEDDKKILLILESETSHSQLQDFDKEQIKNIILQLNQYLFDLYNWSISDHIIKMME